MKKFINFLLITAVILATSFAVNAQSEALVREKVIKENLITDSIVQQLNKEKVSINFEATKYKPGFSYISSEGYKITLLRYEKFDEVFGVNLYYWQAKVQIKGGDEVLVITHDRWIDMAVADNAFYNGKKRRLEYKDNKSKLYPDITTSKNSGSRLR